MTNPAPQATRTKNRPRAQGAREFTPRSWTRPRLVQEYDYIAAPQATGYRSVHLVYEFCSARHPSFEDMLCEVQLRTPDQHAWATAVEVAGFFKNQDLKGGIGDQDWLRFFALAAGAIALKENSNSVPGAPKGKAALIDELRDVAQRLDVIRWMSGFHFAPTIPKRAVPGTFWYLLEFDSDRNMVDWTAYTLDETEEANAAYLEVEKESIDNPNLQVVLVSAEGLRALRTAYPSFFGDSAGFVRVMKPLLGG